MGITSTSSVKSPKIIPKKEYETLYLSSTKNPLTVEIEIINYGNAIIPKGSMIVNATSNIIKFNEIVLNPDRDLEPNESKIFNLTIIFPNNITPDDYVVSGFLKYQNKNYFDFFYPISIYRDKEKNTLTPGKKDEKKEIKKQENFPPTSIINNITIDSSKELEQLRKDNEKLIKKCNGLTDLVKNRLANNKEDQNYKQKYEDLLKWINQKKENIKICNNQGFEILTSNEITMI